MPESYDHNEHGMITHVHIYTHCSKNSFEVRAGLTFSFGYFKTIVWNNPDERKFYLTGIDGYTLFIDDRVSSAHAATYKNYGG